MRKGYYEDVVVFFVKRFFHLRFFLSRLTQKSIIAKKIIDKLLFEDDEIYVLPNNSFLNKSTETNNSDNLSTNLQNQNSNNHQNKNLKTNNQNYNTINEKMETNKTTITTNIEVNQSFNKEDSEFLPADLLKTAIKQAEDIVIMNNCLCRISNDCKDYPQDLGCIFLGPATRKIAPKYGRKATVEEALKHIDWAESVGLSHVIGRNKIDTLWMNVGPKEELLTICHCCPCCCLWKVIPDLHEDISEKIMRLKGVSIKTENKNCTLCKKCLGNDVCFGGAIYLENDTIKIDHKKCVGCGHCVKICNQRVFNLKYTKESLNYVLDRIDKLVDYKKEIDY